jgi:hypothetical protein
MCSGASSETGLFQAGFFYWQLRNKKGEDKYVKNQVEDLDCKVKRENNEIILWVVKNIKKEIKK